MTRIFSGELLYCPRASDRAVDKPKTPPPMMSTSVMSGSYEVESNSKNAQDQNRHVQKLTQLREPSNSNCMSRDRVDCSFIGNLGCGLRTVSILLVSRPSCTLCLVVLPHITCSFEGVFTSSRPGQPHTRTATGRPAQRGYYGTATQGSLQQLPAQCSTAR